MSNVPYVYVNGHELLREIMLICGMILVGGLGQVLCLLIIDPNR